MSQTMPWPRGPYEHRSQGLLSRTRFLRRVLRHAVAAASLVLLSLAAGAIGYHLIAGLPWIDAVLNAAMILGGMGPVDPLRTDGAKLFATVYALYSGITFLAVSAVLVAPFAHRLLHALHLEESPGDQVPGSAPGDRPAPGPDAGGHGSALPSR